MKNKITEDEPKRISRDFAYNVLPDLNGLIVIGDQRYSKSLVGNLFKDPRTYEETWKVGLDEIRKMYAGRKGPREVRITKFNSGLIQIWSED